MIPIVEYIIGPNIKVRTSKDNRKKKKDLIFKILQYFPIADYGYFEHLHSRNVFYFFEDRNKYKIFDYIPKEIVDNTCVEITGHAQNTYIYTFNFDKLIKYYNYNYNKIEKNIFEWYNKIVKDNIK